MVSRLSRWGPIMGIIGGLIWAAVISYATATTPSPGLLLIMQDPRFALPLVAARLFQSVGFWGLAHLAKGIPVARAATRICAIFVTIQSVLFAAYSIPGPLIIIVSSLADLIITITLVLFTIFSIASTLPISVKVIPILMITFYIAGWVLDTGSYSHATQNFPNALSVVYGLLWVPFAFALRRGFKNQFSTNGTPSHAA